MDDVRAELVANARLKLERVLLQEIETWEAKIARGDFHETDVLWLEVLREERDRRWSGPFR